MPDARSLAAHTDTTLAALDLTDVEAAASELARRYAAEIDGAAAWRARADRAARSVLDEHGPESALYEEVEALRAKLAERTALAGIGKLLHALLAELCATPKSRGGARPPAPKAGRLHALRGGRAAGA